jgi:hypothetical protein
MEFPKVLELGISCEEQFVLSGTFFKEFKTTLLFLVSSEPVGVWFNSFPINKFLNE